MRSAVSTDPAIYAPGPVPQELDKRFLRWVHAELHRIAANLRQLGEAGGGLPNIYLDDDGNLILGDLKGIGIGNTFATADPQATIHIANTDARHIRLEYSTNFNFDITNKGFNGTEIYSQNPFGSFFDLTVVVLNCGFQRTGGRLLEIQNGGVAVAYIDAQGNYVKI
jgi:hypothetical protein